MPTDLGEGTLIFEMAPPTPWPQAKETLIDTSFHTKDAEFTIYAVPSGQLKVTLFAGGQPAVVIHTCPVTFDGTGLFRLVVAHKQESVVIFAGGECIASHNDETASVASKAIMLRDELPPSSDDDPPEWTAKPGRRDVKY